MKTATNTASAPVASVDLTTVSNASLRELTRDEKTFTAEVKAECARRNAIYRAEAARIEARKAAAKRGMSVAEMNRLLFGATGLGGK